MNLRNASALQGGFVCSDKNEPFAEVRFCLRLLCLKSEPFFSESLKLAFAFILLRFIIFGHGVVKGGQFIVQFELSTPMR